MESLSWISTLFYWEDNTVKTKNCPTFQNPLEKQHTKNLLNKTLLHAVKLKQVNKAFPWAYKIIRKFTVSYWPLRFRSSSLDNKGSEKLMVPTDKVLPHQIQGICVNFKTEGGLKFSASFNFNLIKKIGKYFKSVSQEWQREVETYSLILMLKSNLLNQIYRALLCI